MSSPALKCDVELGEVAPELRLIGCTTAQLWQAYILSAAGSNEARALLEVLCLRETIGRMIRAEMDRKEEIDGLASGVL